MRFFRTRVRLHNACQQQIDKFIFMELSWTQFTVNCCVIVRQLHSSVCVNYCTALAYKIVVFIYAIL